MSYYSVIAIDSHAFSGALDTGAVLSRQIVPLPAENTPTPLYAGWDSASAPIGVHLGKHAENATVQYKYENKTRHPMAIFLVDNAMLACAADDIDLGRNIKKAIAGGDPAPGYLRGVWMNVHTCEGHVMALVGIIPPGHDMQLDLKKGKQVVGMVCNPCMTDMAPEAAAA